MDGMTVQQLPEHLKQYWPEIREQLLSGTYKPQPVKRVEIPKPDGGVRKLGIPTVLDRFIQQAVMQVLQRRWDRTFSGHSYGFRPGRGCKDALRRVDSLLKAGKTWVVDADLKSYFDTIPKQKLMGEVADHQNQTGKAEVDIPAREMLADMLFELKQPEKALAEYEKSMKIDPNRFNGLAGAAQAAEVAHQPAKANTYSSQLLKNCDDGKHSERTELKNAKKLVAMN